MLGGWLPMPGGMAAPQAVARTVSPLYASTVFVTILCHLFQHPAPRSSSSRHTNHPSLVHQTVRATPRGLFSDFLYRWKSQVSPSRAHLTATAVIPNILGRVLHLQARQTGPTHLLAQERPSYDAA